MSSTPLLKRKFTVNNSDIDDVYRLCEEWLISIRAKILEKNSSSSIEALHWRYKGDNNPRLEAQGSALPSLRIEDMEKIFKFTLFEAEPFVEVVVSIQPYSWIEGLDNFKNRERVWIRFFDRFRDYLHEKTM